MQSNKWNIFWIQDFKILSFSRVLGDNDLCSRNFCNNIILPAILVRGINHRTSREHLVADWALCKVESQVEAPKCSGLDWPTTQLLIAERVNNR